MTILTRIIQLFKADMHAVMDQMEDQELLLKQHLRDMQECLFQKETQLKQMGVTRDQVQQDYEKGKNEIDCLEQDLEVAIKKDRDDIARTLIKKLKPFIRIQSERCHHINLLNQEIKQFKANIDQQRLQYEQLRQKATAYFHRAEKQNWKNRWSNLQPENIVQLISEEEVELELLRRKELLKGGAAS